MSALKRYLDSLANGPLLDPVVAVRSLYLHAEEGHAVDKAALLKKRTTVEAACKRAKPLVVPKRRRHKG